MSYYSQCSGNPKEVIENRVESLGETFLREYVQVGDEKGYSSLKAKHLRDYTLAFKSCSSGIIDIIDVYWN